MVFLFVGEKGKIMKIEVLLTVAAIVIFFVVKAVYDYFYDKKRLETYLAESFGCLPDCEYRVGKLDSIKAFYNMDSSDGDLDDITWNDLEMDELYKILNHTRSAMGEEVLYKLLRKPVFNKDILDKRNKLIDYFFENESDRIAIEKKLSRIGKDSKLSFYEYFMLLDNVKKEKPVIHYIINLIWLVCIAGLLFNYSIFAGVLIFNILFSIGSYYRRKAHIEMYYHVFNQVIKMLYCAENIGKSNIDIIKEHTSVINACIKKYKGFKRNSSLVLKANGGNLSDIVFDYFRMLTHVDLIKFDSMHRFIMENQDTLLKIHEEIGYIDFVIAIASFRKMNEKKGLCIPEFTKEKRILRFSDGYHPFIEEPVYNSFDTSNCVLLTGSNASGKSTFLKMTAINAILAQTIVTVCAKKYISSFYHVMTSMALTDNIFGSKSYFIVEIMSLKRIVDASQNEDVLSCIDEVLRGTNTIERIAASSEILRALSYTNTLCFAATHDIELAHILENCYNNYHFEESVTEDDVVFDYKIHDGYSKTRNAIKLLSVLGFDSNIVNGAKNMAASFEKNGLWDIYG